MTALEVTAASSLLAHLLVPVPRASESSLTVIVAQTVSARAHVFSFSFRPLGEMYLFPGEFLLSLWFVIIMQKLI